MDPIAAEAWRHAAEKIAEADLTTEAGRRAVLTAYRRARSVERRERVDRLLSPKP